MAVWTTETILVDGKGVKGVQVREDRPFSLVRLDSARMTFEEQAAVIRHFAPGTQKRWAEGQFTVLRVQTTLIKRPELRERFGTGEQEAPAQTTQQQGPEEFVYEGQINEKQLPFLRRWAADRGARVEEVNAMSTAEGVVWTYRIVSGADLLERQRIQRDIERTISQPTPFQEAIGGFTPTDQLITKVPSVETIEKEEREAMVQKTAKEIVEKQGPAARIRTLLSPEGLEFIGAVALGKDPTSIVQRKIEQEVRLQMVETDPTAKFQRSLVDTVTSPIFEVVTSFAGGVAFARVGATTIGAKILATKVAKTALAVGAVSFVAVSGFEAHTDIAMGRVERGVGRIITTGAALGAGFAGAKLGAREFAKIPTKLDAKIDPTKTKGVSLSTPETKVSPGKSVGMFETKIQVGKKTIPVRGTIIGVSKSVGKKRALQQVRIFIPEQKFGKITIKETTLIRAGTIEQTGKGLFTVRTSEGIIIDSRVGRELDIVLAGSKRGTGFFVEKAKIQKGTDTIRFFTGSGVETTGKVSAKDITRATRLLAKGTPASKIGGVPRTDVKVSGIQDVLWVDVSKPTLKGPPIAEPLMRGFPGASVSKPTKGPALHIKVTESPAPVVPSGKISVTGTRESLSLPTLTVTSAIAATTATGSVARTARKVKSLPVSLSLGPEKTKQRTRVAEVVKTKPLSLQTAVSAIQIQVAKRDVDFVGKQINDIEMSVGVTERQAQAVTSKQITRAPTRLAHEPAPVNVPILPPPIVPPSTPPTISLGLPGVLVLRGGVVGATKFKIKTIVNPVAATLNVKGLKLGGLI